MKYESLQSPGSVWREELHTRVCRRVDSASVDGLVLLQYLHAQPGRELTWNPAQEVLKWMQ